MYLWTFFNFAAYIYLFSFRENIYGFWGLATSMPVQLTSEYLWSANVFSHFSYSYFGVPEGYHQT